MGKNVRVTLTLDEDAVLRFSRDQGTFLDVVDFVAALRWAEVGPNPKTDDLDRKLAESEARQKSDLEQSILGQRKSMTDAWKSWAISGGSIPSGEALATIRMWQCIADLANAVDALVSDLSTQDLLSDDYEDEHYALRNVAASAGEYVKDGRKRLDGPVERGKPMGITYG